MPPEKKFLRGDADATGVLELTDAIRTLGYLFLGTQPPVCFDAADSDDSGILELTGMVLFAWNVWPALSAAARSQGAAPPAPRFTVATPTLPVA